ncbi:MAG: NifB/NifX family molybdenum-iron cluster-binding protein [Spirochaetaceae bacterium]|nr:NifB/NifX family molybdenum-iron cluster-binding protein [Spirochaetaceae bacterium]MDT8297163.1 NifB/NifX family molybdenum-iron cluster-binding protein [Spirochaetaceae bacterium]
MNEGVIPDEPVLTRPASAVVGLEDEMVLAFCVKDDSVSAVLDERFGRSKSFDILDSENGEILSRMVNPGAEASGSARISAVQTLVNAGVQGFVAPHLGPKAEDARKRLGIRVWNQGAHTDVDSALEARKKGELEEVPIDSPPPGLHRA